MKSGKKMFFFIEAVLAVAVVFVALSMVWEGSDKDRKKVSVIVRNSDDDQWAAFKYGLKMAAEDKGVEAFVVSTGTALTVEEQRKLIETELNNGADAVVMQPLPGTDAKEMTEEIGEKVPVILVADLSSEDADIEGCVRVDVDNYGIGKMLAEEIVRDCGDVSGKVVGILMEDAQAASLSDRKEGLEDELEKRGALVEWTKETRWGEEGKSSIDSCPDADIVAALDDTSLTAAGEYAAAGNFGETLVYGVGHSMESAYYLDTGRVECLAVPDEFNVGYQSLAEAAERLFVRRGEEDTKKISCTIMRRDTMFLEENQEILFTMSQ